MKMPFLTILILFIIALYSRIYAAKRKEEKQSQDFWKRETQANATRMKDISSLPYIVIPVDTLPLSTDIEDSELLNDISIVLELADKKILNLTGYTNTDLKLEYGAPNIIRLTEYDSNFTTLVSALSRIANKYLEYGKKEDAISILEYGILINSDVRLNYELLANCYLESNNYEGIKHLKEVASNLNSLSKEPILRSLSRIDPTIV